MLKCQKLMHFSNDNRNKFIRFFVLLGNTNHSKPFPVGFSLTIKDTIISLSPYAQNPACCKHVDCLISLITHEMGSVPWGMTYNAAGNIWVSFCSNFLIYSVCDTWPQTIATLVSVIITVMWIAITTWGLFWKSGYFKELRI